LAAFSRYLTRLPKSGAWTEGVKHLAGIALVTASILFLRSYLSVEVFRATILALMLFVVGFASRLFPGSFHKVVRITVAGLIPLVLLSLRPEIRPSGVPGIPWLSSERQGLASARSSRKPVVIDFWAQWCAACVDLDRETYADPRVEKEIRERFIAVKIDATDDSDEVRALMGKYRVVGLPTVLFADADGKVFQEQTVNGFVSAEELLAVLEKVRAGLSR
jgi:thiol:disulfide interchange protein DsbD